MSSGKTVQSVSTYGITHGSNPRDVNWQFYAGTNHAAGCLAVATPQESPQLPGYFLYRFGVLLAANALAIARSLINHLKVLLADEPTGNLNPHTGVEELENEQ